MMTSIITSTDVEKFHTHLSSSGKNLETVKKYVRDITRLSRYLSDRSLSFTQSALDEYIESIRQQGYSIRSINSAIASIRSFCRFADREDLQCKSFNVRRKNNLNEQNCLTSEEYMTLIHAAEENRNYALAY